MPSLLGDVAILNIGSENFNNKNRVDHNDFGGDSSDSGSWNKSRGRKSRSHGRKDDKGRGKY